ncbi:MAG: PQQ-binding-like beta-propeller repeat protein [Spirochaetaceae bacterium]|jgi:outer membrane protein assembly factor BamB|nr:PQQ-binding-like beta-propeller repeat protein [Spirochaetaceae bacterium]
MKTFKILLLLLFVFLSGCTPHRWNEFRGVRGQGLAPSAIQPPLAVKWRLKLQDQGSSRRFFNQPLLVNNTIYFGSADGNFYSFDLHSGYMNWTFRTQGPINAVAAVDKDRVYIGSSDGFAYCLSRDTGVELWRFKTNGAVNSTLVPWNDGIMVASDADAFYYLSRDGELRFSIANQAWVSNSFQIYKDILAFAPGTPENPHALTVYDLKKQRTLWALDTSSNNHRWYSFPATRGSRLYYSAVGFDGSSWIYRFSAVNLRYGWDVWTQDQVGLVPGDTSGIFAQKLFREQRILLDYGAPLLWRNQVIFAPGDMTLRSFGSATGRPIWQKSYELPVATAPTLAGGRLYFGLRAPQEEGNNQGYLVCAHPRNGRVLWKIPVDGTILNSPVIAGPWIIFGTDSGDFYVLEEIF